MTRQTRELSDSQPCADGTSYEVHSEHVRGEPRFYWVMWHGPRGAKPTGYGGSEDRRSAQRAARRLAVAHDEETAT